MFSLVARRLSSLTLIYSYQRSQDRYLRRTCTKGDVEQRFLGIRRQSRSLRRQVRQEGLHRDLRLENIAKDVYRFSSVCLILVTLIAIILGAVMTLCSNFKNIGRLFMNEQPDMCMCHCVSGKVILIKLA